MFKPLGQKGLIPHPNQPGEVSLWRPFQRAKGKPVSATATLTVRPREQRSQWPGGGAVGVNQLVTLGRLCGYVSRVT